MPEKDHSSTVSLEGSYKLVAFTRKVVDTGEVYDTSGKEPGGYINYTRDGRMLVLMVSDKNERPAPEKFVALSDEQAASLFRTMVAYGGAYEFDGHTVKHHIDISWSLLQNSSNAANFPCVRGGGAAGAQAGAGLNWVTRSI